MESSTSLMTEGCIWKKIVKFALPIFWGNLFQQLYNIVDSIVVGNFVGRDALAAISSTGSLIFLLVGFFGGIFMGAGVVISKYFGAGKKDSVQKAIHTAIAFALVAGIVLTLAGTIFTPQILKLMGTPEAVLSNATLYLRIYFSGVLSIVLYNTCSGIFQAVGDSKHPLYYLIISSIVNVVLDLLFVVVFKWGIGGAAFATIISQTVSVCLAFYKLSTTKDIYKVNFRKISFDFSVLKEIVRLGFPAGIQNSVIALANVVVQANINSFGSIAMAGCGSYSKIEGFVFIPITSFAMAMTTFMGQNLGAKEYDRAKKGAKFGIITSIIIAELIGITFYVLAPYLIALFNNEPEVVRFGTSQARTVALFYFLLALSHCIAGILRGAGKAIIPMFVMLLCWCIIRVTYITIATHFIPKIQVVFWAYPLTWCLSSIIFLVYFLKCDWLHGFEKEDCKKA